MRKIWKKLKVAKIGSLMRFYIKKFVLGVPSSFFQEAAVSELYFIGN